MAVSVGAFGSALLLDIFKRTRTAEIKISFYFRQVFFKYFKFTRNLDFFKHQQFRFYEAQRKVLFFCLKTKQVGTNHPPKDPDHPQGLKFEGCKNFSPTERMAGCHLFWDQE